MPHAIELIMLLLLMAVGHATVNVAPGWVVRIVRSFVVWVLTFAVGIALLCIPSVAVWVVRAGIVLMVAYLARWLLDMVVDFFRGPFLLALPSVAALAEALHTTAGLRVHVCRKLARRINRNHDGFIALLGLAHMKTDVAGNEEAALAAWQEASEKALEPARDMARRLGGYAAGDRVRTSDIRFVAQALCLFEQKSVDRVLKSAKARVLGHRFARARAAKLLEESATRSPYAERIGLTPPVKKKVKRRPGERRFNVLSPLWPALGMARSGFSARAAVLTISQLVLIGYGAFAVSFEHASGWVYLAVAVLIHVEGYFALEDFGLADEHFGRSDIVTGEDHEQA